MVFAGCLSQSAAELEQLGITLAPYLVMDQSTGSAQVITSVNSQAFVLAGDCGEAGGSVVILHTSLGQVASTSCSGEKTWSVSLDLSTAPDGIYEFSIRHTRLDGQRYTEVKTPAYYKVTAPPSAPSIERSSTGVNPSLSGGTFTVQWEGSTDSAGQPLVSYEVKVVSPDGQTEYQPWTSVGEDTEATLAIPQSGGSYVGNFVVKIKGVDQAQQSTAEQPISVSLDQTAPTNSTSISASPSQMNSLNQSPSLSWNPSLVTDTVGVDRLEYRVVLQSNPATVIKGWTTMTATTSSVVITGLSLTAGTDYLFFLRGVDLAGNASSETSGAWRAIQITPTLILSSIPSSATVGSSMSVTVSLQDGNGNAITSPDVSVSLELFTDASCSNSASGSLSGSSVTSSSGVASFSSFSTTSVGTYYVKASAPGYAVACSTGTLVVSAFTCPSGYIRVPGNSSLSVSDFCVMKYEARDVGGSAASVSTGNPWLNISQNDSKTKCTALGSNYDLISNPEWMTIARNVEADARNWSGSAVGSGALAMGHSDNSPSSVLGISDSNAPYTGTGNSTSSGWAQRRTLHLSNDEVIWDLSGNAWEFIDWTPGGALDNPVYSPCVRHAWTTLPTASTSSCTGLPTASYLPGNPSNILASTYDAAYGLGALFGYDLSGSAAHRGGDFANVGNTGVFTLALGANSFYPTTPHSRVTFRCVYRP